MGAMGSEPTCSLYTFALAPAGGAGGPAVAQQAGAAGGQAGGQPLLRLVHTLSCQPHKLLTCHLEQPAAGAQEPPTPDTHLQGGAAREAGTAGTAAGAPYGGGGIDGSGGSQAGPRLLLGLTDDVDCAVVAIGCASPEAAAAGASTSSGASGPEEAAAGFVIQHVASVPALSYVTAGEQEVVGELDGGRGAGPTRLLAETHLPLVPDAAVCHDHHSVDPISPHHPCPALLFVLQARCSASSCCWRPPVATLRQRWWRPASTAVSWGGPGTLVASDAEPKRLCGGRDVKHCWCVKASKSCRERGMLVLIIAGDCLALFKAVSLCQCLPWDCFLATLAVQTCTAPRHHARSMGSTRWGSGSVRAALITAFDAWDPVRPC